MAGERSGASVSGRSTTFCNVSIEREVLRLRVRPSGADHDALGEQALTHRDNLAENVLEGELALFETRRSASPTLPGLSVPSSAIERVSSVDGGRRNHIAQAHAKRQELSTAS